MESMIAKLLQDFEQGRMTRRQLIKSLAVAASAAAAVEAVPAQAQSGGLAARALSINHVSYQVADYTKTRDFYSSLFGMKVSDDNGKQCRLTFGPNIIIARNEASGTPNVDHIAYTLENWDADKSLRGKVHAELKNRSLDIRETPGGFHFKDPDGFHVQIGGKDQ